MGCSSSSNANKNLNNLNSLSLTMNDEIVDKILSSAPERTKTTIEGLGNYFKKESKLSKLKAQDKVLLVFKWVSNNISFDCEDFMIKLKDKDDMNYLSEEENFSEGRANSHGYSNLFMTLLSEVDSSIETKIIHGYIKDFRYKYGHKYKEPNHEWVAVNINFRWHMVDPTLGAGYCQYIDKKLIFFKDYNQFYCLPPAEIFIKTNFPQEEVWQLNQKKIKIDEFYKYPLYRRNFFKLKFKSMEPEEGVLEVKKEGKIIVNLQKDVDIKNIFVSGNLTYKEINDKSKSKPKPIKEDNILQVFIEVIPIYIRVA